MGKSLFECKINKLLKYLKKSGKKLVNKLPSQKIKEI